MHLHTLFFVNASIFAIALFLYGFFPIKTYNGFLASDNDFPSLIGDIEVNVSSSYQGTVGRLVIMVIDALRWDFVHGHEGSINMPFLTSVIKKNGACCVTGKADPPTVTMPRIKALVTGTVPNFVDVVLNFGSSQITEDNILLQASKHESKIIFYGDDTWLKLFPDQFERSEGTTSFFVTDFIEVDNNVTRHLTKELNNLDWRIMILHYLGLDHIGHLEGPKSLLVRPKLQEMDSIVKTIYLKLQELDEVSDKPSALVVCGDHGMKDTGSHGGASEPEVMVPVVILSQICSGSSSSVTYEDVVSQIDLASTLSVLLGLPIPAGNLGKIITKVLHKLPLARQLYALHYNTKQVAKQYEINIANSLQKESYLKFEEAVKLHSQWLKLGGAQNPGLDETISGLYSTSLQGMSEELAESMVYFDLYAMCVSMVILWQICTIMFVRSFCSKKLIILRKKSFTSLHLPITIIFLNSLYCNIFQCNSLLCRCTLYPILITFLTVAVITVNSYELISLYRTKMYFHLFPSKQNTSALIFGSTLYLISLTSSSFIEEEHQVWYFLWATFSILLLYNLFVNGGAQFAWQWLLVLVAHRILRSWNQTGDKWAHLPDIGNWLGHTENQKYYCVNFILGLLGIYASCDNINAKSIQASTFRKMALRLLCASAVFCIYLYRCSIGNVSPPFNYPHSRGVVEVGWFWWILLSLILSELGNQFYLLKIRRQKGDSLTVFNHVICTVTICWILLSALLQRPHNVILIPVQIFFSGSVGKVVDKLKQNERVVWLCATHVWIGYVFYFYQGNSNSLASLDIASGYAGQVQYNPVKVGILLISNTYSAFILSYLLLVTRLSRKQQPFAFQPFNTVLGQIYNITACLRLFPISVYVVLITYQRYHLFVWTVFSPKLLYEAMHCSVTFFLLSVTQVLVKVAETVVYKLSNQCS